jgi:hypothetical protein
MTIKITRLTHKIAIQLHLVTESYTIWSSRSRRPVRKLFGYTFVTKVHNCITNERNYKQCHYISVDVNDSFICLDTHQEEKCFKQTN